jgi:hypothetical protein
MLFQQFIAGRRGPQFHGQHLWTMTRQVANAFDDYLRTVADYAHYGWSATNSLAVARKLAAEGPKIEKFDGPLWEGFYISTDRKVAAGYLGGDGRMMRVYLKKGAGRSIEGLESGVGMESMTAANRWQAIKDQEPAFAGLTGPQDLSSDDKELYRPETVLIGTDIRKVVLLVPLPANFFEVG